MESSAWRQHGPEELRLTAVTGGQVRAKKDLAKVSFEVTEFCASKLSSEIFTSKQTVYVKGQGYGVISEKISDDSFKVKLRDTETTMNLD